MGEKKACLPLLDIEKVLPILSRISILGGLTDKQLFWVFRRMENVSYRRGETVFEQGDGPSHIYILLTGRVKIVASEKGTSLELAEYGPGQCFGETSCIGILPQSATALVAEDSEFLVLSAAALHGLYQDDPALFGILILNIAREACRRLYKTDEVMLHYATAKIM